MTPPLAYTRTFHTDMVWAEEGINAIHSDTPTPCFAGGVPKTLEFWRETGFGPILGF